MFNELVEIVKWFGERKPNEALNQILVVATPKQTVSGRDGAGPAARPRARPQYGLYLLRSLEFLAGGSSSWRRLCERCTPVVCTGGVPASSSVSPPSADSELSAPSAPLLLSSCASGMAEASGPAPDEPAPAPAPPVPAPPDPALPPPLSKFAFCSSTLPDRDRNKWGIGRTDDTNLTRDSALGTLFRDTAAHLIDLFKVIDNQNTYRITSFIKIRVSYMIIHSLHRWFLKIYINYIALKMNNLESTIVLNSN